jgi:nucleotide-binding universal stress UspA family protein
MEKLIKKYKLKPDEYRSKIVRGGDLSSVIAKEAKKTRAEMIIMGSHGRSGIQRFFLGSVAERTLRYASCPTLIVKNKSEWLRLLGFKLSASDRCLSLDPNERRSGG